MCPPRRFALLLVLAALAGTPRSGHADGLTRRERGDLAIRARAILETYCLECHKGDKPRPTLAILDHKALIAKDAPVSFVNLLNPARSQVIEFIEDGSMPPGGRPRPTPAELVALKEWVKAQAPRFPPAFDDHTTLEVMLDDWAAQPQDDRPHLRYLSFANLVREGRAHDLAETESRLQKALLAGSGKLVAPPEPVDDTATLFRLDLRKLGWNAIDLFVRVEKDQPRDNTYPIIPYDLILLEDPHTDTGLVGEKDALAVRLKEFLKTTDQLRPVPFLRGEWVAEVLGPGKPLTADLRSLVDLAAARAKRSPPPCGPPAHPFARAKPLEFEATTLPPLASWYTGDVTPHNDPFGLKVEVVHPLSGNKAATEVKINEPFRLRVRAERRVRFVVLKVLPTGTIGLQPVSGDDIIKPGESRLLGPPAGKPFEFASLLTGGKEETQHFVIIASDGEPPTPLLIRSRHADGPGCSENQNPVWRFVFDRANGNEKNGIVRKVVAVKVVAKP
jgi:hypothetical protein